MKIISYNINGIRAGIEKGLLNWLQSANPDVIGFQEVKALENQIDQEAIKALGYEIYWFAAEKKGYSGVAFFTKAKPKNVYIGCNNPIYDSEGRTIRLDFEDFSIINVYMPSGSSGDERQEFKYQWMDYFYEYIQKLLLEIPNLIIMGDYNICHHPIDIHNPKSNANSSGFLPEERAWLQKFVELGFVDSFRQFNKEPHNYTWWSYRAGARGKNLGWRIDYQMVTENLKSKLTRSVILRDAMHSDHCPIMLEINCL